MSDNLPSSRDGTNQSKKKRGPSHLQTLVQQRLSELEGESNAEMSAEERNVIKAHKKR